MAVSQPILVAIINEDGKPLNDLRFINFSFKISFPKQSQSITNLMKYI